MGKSELAALARVIEEQQARGSESLVLGTWRIDYDKKREAFVFDKCEAQGYCEERPAVIAKDGTVLDEGGPLFG
ncbi:MAG TPA: hypothetical protein QGF35_03080 [Dehalococcoidia bacterium]|nr:hypothetical protein [Dehalococcoidia bacterium]